MLVRGRVDVVEGPALEGRWREVLTRVARRYIGPNGDEYLERSREIKRFLLRLGRSASRASADFAKPGRASRARHEVSMAGRATDGLR